MKNTTVLILSLSIAIAVLFIGAIGTAGAADEHMYTGIKKCGMCHKDAKKVWEAGPHAGALKTLASEASKKIAAEKGIEDPTKAKECLSCHVTAAGVDAKLLDKGFKADEGVTCEACHGPGKDYQAMKVMKDHAAAVAAGLVEQNEKVCVTCHNEKSPTFKGFKYDEYKKKIDHWTKK